MSNSNAITRIGLLWLITSLAAVAQNTTVRSVTSLPASCSPGQGVGGKPADHVDLWNGSVNVPYYCSSANTWTVLTGGVTPGVGGSGTANTIPKWTASTTLGNSSATDNGTTLSTSDKLTVGGGEIDVTGGAASALIMTESASTAGVAGQDIFWPDSTNHRWEMNNNNGGAFVVGGIAVAGTPGNCLKIAADGFNYTDSGAGCGTGSGNVSTFSAGNLSPLFTTSVATPTTTPALSFSLSNAAVGTFLGNATSSAAGPAYVTLSAINPQTATYQVTATDFAAYKTITVASGTFTITLVASGSQPAAGQYINIVNYGSGVVTIARSGQNINGGTTSLTLPAASATAPSDAEIWSDGTNYFSKFGSGTSGTVTNVTGTSPVASSGGATPAISINNNGITATQLAAQYSKGSCTEVWGGSGTSNAMQSGDDAIVNNSCYNDSGVTRTITALKCRSDNAANTTVLTPTFGSAGTGTAILTGTVTCGNSYAYSATGTLNNTSWTTGTGIDPGMSTVGNATSIAMIVEYTY